MSDARADEIMKALTEMGVTDVQTRLLVGMRIAFLEGQIEHERQRANDFKVGLVHFYQLGYSHQNEEDMRAWKMPESVIEICAPIRQAAVDKRGAGPRTPIGQPEPVADSVSDNDVRKIRHRVVSKKPENVDTSAEPVDVVRRYGSSFTVEAPPCPKCGTAMVVGKRNDWQSVTPWLCPQCTPLKEILGPGNQMDAPGGPRCRCGKPSRRESGDCGEPHADSSDDRPRCLTCGATLRFDGAVPRNHPIVSQWFCANGCGDGRSTPGGGT